MKLKQFQLEDIRNNEEIIEEITQMEKKLETQIGKHVALIAYTEDEILENI